MSKGLKSWIYLCENGFVDIPIPQGNENDEEIDDYAIGCAYDIEDSLKALEISKELIAKIKELCKKYETEPFDFGFKTILQLILEREKELYD